MNDTDPSKSSQCDHILAWLQLGNKITMLQALEKFQCGNLKGRIHDLKTRGIRIAKTWLKIARGKKVAEYFIEKEEPAIAAASAMKPDRGEPAGVSRAGLIQTALPL